MPDTNPSFMKSPLYYRAVPSYVDVDRVLLGRNLKSHELVKKKLRWTRRPELGDIFNIHYQNPIIIICIYFDKWIIIRMFACNNANMI